MRPRGAGSPLLWALVPVVAVLLWVGFKPLERSSAAMRFPYQLDREEGFLLDQAMHLARFDTIYPSLADYPYTVGNYPPVYPAVWAGFLAVAPPSLSIGRAIVLLSVMLIAAVIGGIVVRHTGRIIPAFLAIGLFLATWDLNDWIAYARVDLPAIALGMAGLYATTSSTRRRAGLWIGCALFAAAFFTKQTQVFAPAALLFGLLATRQATRAGWLAAGTGLMVAGPFVLLSLLTGGEFFRHLVVYNANAMHWDQLAVWGRHLWFFGKFKLICLTVLLIALAVPRLRKIWRLPSPAVGDFAPEAMQTAAHFVMLTSLSLVSSAKAGSAPNYLLEFQAACALFIGLAIGRLANLADGVAVPARRWLLGTMAVAVVVLWCHAGLFFFPQGRARLFQPGPVEAQAEALRMVQLAIQDTPGDVLCEEPIFAILAGKPVLYQPFIMSQLAKEGKWDETPFVEDLGSGRFELIVTTQDLSRRELPLAGFTEAMRDAILADYELRRVIGGAYLYVPRESRRRPPEPRVARTERWKAPLALRFGGPSKERTSSDRSGGARSRTN